MSPGRTLGLIWAQSSSGVIGRDGGIPWDLPEDLARFKEVTFGRTVVMGRRTWESLPKRVRPLPGRRNVVVTRNPDYRAPGADVVTADGRPLTASMPSRTSSAPRRRMLNRQNSVFSGSARRALSSAFADMR